MGAPELLALSLALSVAVAALGLAGGMAIERLSGDPVLRDRSWGAALLLPLLPPLATLILLMTPPPVREIVTGPASTFTAAVSVGTPQATPFLSSGPAFDPGLIAQGVLAVAGLLALIRIAALLFRARRLALLLRTAESADAQTLEIVRDAALTLAITPPPVLISAATPEAMLAGLRPARLVLPTGLNVTDAGVRRAVIAHELAHLKRGDHRALWVEELTLALLAANPLMPLLRARRTAAREEACDAVALADAGIEIRRAYAQSLIEALRTRASSQGTGALPALTFTGAGRTTAMHRLKAVLTPAAPATRRARIGASAGIAALLAVVAGGTAAVAAQREPTIQNAVQYSATARFVPDVRELLNGAPLPEGLPVWALNPERVDVRTRADEDGEMNFILPFTGRSPISVNGRRLPEGFPVTGINPDAVADMSMDGDHMMITLKPETDVRGRRTGEDPAADAAAAVTRAANRSETQAKFQRASATDFRRYCASSEADESGFCAGVMFNQIGSPGVCAPAELSGAGDRGPALNAYVTRGKQEVARLSPRRDEATHEYASRALQQAYPCQTSRIGNSPVVVWMPVSFDGNIELKPGDRMHVTLNTGAGTQLAEAMGNGGDLHIPLTEAEFPGLGQGNRAYTLNAAILRADGSVETADEAITVRLAPGSQGSARNLSARLGFGE